MEKSEFLKWQFTTLREEIKDSKNRMFKLTLFGVTIVPAGQYLSNIFKLEMVLVSLPIFVIILALLYLAENHAVMRCGRYIRLHIEPEVNELIGWEEWLETEDVFDTRTVDKYVNRCFYTLFFAYYLVSVYLASEFILKKLTSSHVIIFLTFYSLIGVWFGYFLIKNLQFSTKGNRKQKSKLL